MRQALAGLLWSKQFYHYVVKRLARRAIPRSRRRPPSAQRGRNHEWTHLYNADVISMPDKWEYPWYAAWDLAFHCVPLALVDPEFAKEQLLLLLREWYMHPNGQLPAYEWAFGDVNPPVHAWAALARLQDREEAPRHGRPRVPRARLPQAAAELHLVGEPQGRRGQERLPGRLPRPRQHRRVRPQRAAADRRPPRAVRRHELDGDVLPEHAGDRAGAGRATNPAYEDVASKFCEHFLYIAHAMNGIAAATRASSCGTRRTASSTTSCTCPTAAQHPAEGALDGRADPAVRGARRWSREVLDRLPGFKRRLEWFIEQPAGPDRATSRACGRRGHGERRLLVARRRRQAAPACCASCSTSASSSRPTASARCRASTATIPYVLRGQRHGVPRGLRAGRIDDAGCSAATRTGAGPIWFPVNYLLIEALQKFHHYFGDDFTVECPTGSGQMMTLVGGRGRTLAPADAHLPARRRRPPARCSAAPRCFQRDPHWRDLIAVLRVLPRRQRRRPRRQPPDRLDGLVAKLLQQSGE